MVGSCCPGGKPIRSITISPSHPDTAVFFMLFIAVMGILAGAVAAMTGFGAGSLLTPALALETGTKLAVAAVAIPHFVASAQRFWMLRTFVDRRILAGFGLASALGGLGGALLATQFSSSELGFVFGGLLILAGLSEFTGWMQRVRWGRRAAWIAGAVSGVLGGMVGNQGGIRTAAMLGFSVPKESFIATATAIALFVDGARLPVYLATQWHELASIWPLVLTATVGAVIGTAFGTRLLGWIPHRLFRRLIAVLLVTLGGYMIARSGGSRTPRAHSAIRRSGGVETMPLHYLWAGEPGA